MVTDIEMQRVQEYYNAQPEGYTMLLMWHNFRDSAERMWKAHRQSTFEADDTTKRENLLVASGYADSVLELLSIIPKHWEHQRFDVGQDEKGLAIMKTYARTEAKAYELVMQRSNTNSFGYDKFVDTFQRYFESNRILKEKGENYDGR